jgi:thymidylate kinase
MRDYQIIIITGVCGVGKTSILPFLKESLDELSIYDLDKVGVPSNPSNEWRIATTGFWIKKCLENLENNKSSILLGMITPQDVEAFIPTENIDRVKFLLLNVTQEERAGRLESRNERRRFILEDRKNIENLERWCNESVFDFNIIETTSDSKEETADKVIQWIILNSNVGHN